MRHNPRPSHPWTQRGIDRDAGLETDYVLRMENRPLWQTPWFDHEGECWPADQELIERAERGEVSGGSLTANRAGRSSEGSEVALLRAVFKKSQIRTCSECRQAFGCSPKAKFTECLRCREKLAHVERQSMWPVRTVLLPPIQVVNGIPHKGDGGFRIFQPKTEAEAEAFYEGLRREAEWRARQTPSDESV